MLSVLNTSLEGVFSSSEATADVDDKFDPRGWVRAIVEMPKVNGVANNIPGNHPQDRYRIGGGHSL